MKKFYFIAGSVLILFLIIINLTKPKSSQNKKQTNLNTGYIKTKKAEFMLPANAYLDGIDKESNLTVMMINIWVSPRQEKVSHTLRHGSMVKILGYNYYQGQVLFKIETGVNTGWVSDLFISDKENKPIGSRI